MNAVRVQRKRSGVYRVTLPGKRGFKLGWSDYKSMHGSLTVYFGGGLQLHVGRKRTRGGKPAGWWRVGWSEDGEPGKLKGLTDRMFTTRHQAMLAAERVFVPMLRLAPFLVGIEVEVKVDGVPRRLR